MAETKEGQKGKAELEDIIELADKYLRDLQRRYGLDNAYLQIMGTPTKSLDIVTFKREIVSVEEGTSIVQQIAEREDESRGWGVHARNYRGHKHYPEPCKDEGYIEKTTDSFGSPVRVVLYTGCLKGISFIKEEIV